MEQEIWKDIKGYEGFYQVSNFGRIRSVDRIVITQDGRNVFYKSKIISETIDRDKYITVKLSKYGTYKSIKLHRLIAQTFMPIDNYKDLEVNHIDFNRTNNKIENLEWVTHSENVHHSSKAGHYKNNSSGCKNGRSTYTEEQVKYIRKLYDEGKTVMDIIKILFPELTYKERKNKWSRIKEIATRKTYKNI